MCCILNEEIGRWEQMDTMGEKEIPIETFDALLHDLVTWDLVVRGEGDDSQTWRLVASSTAIG